METPLRPHLTSALLAAASVCVMASASAAKAAVVLDWTFETLGFRPGPSQFTTASAISNIFPEFNPGQIAAAASLVHKNPVLVWAWFVGNGSAQSLASANWAVGDYYQFNFGPNTYSALSFSMTGAVGTPKDFQLQYAQNGDDIWDHSY